MKLCELCKEEASVYCFADAAFLCLNCDAKVHQANFLVARHLRHFLCSKCKSSLCLQKRPSYLGSQAETAHHLCKACCSSRTSSPLPSSSSSDCLSSNCESSYSDFKFKTTTKPAHSSATSASEVTNSNSNTNINSRLEGIFGIWCNKLGLSRRDVIPTATAALRLCLERFAVLPSRESLASAFWVGLRLSEERRSVATCQVLRRLEELSGVPAKLIVAVEPKLARVIRLRRRRIRQDFEEGWAECNV